MRPAQDTGVRRLGNQTRIANVMPDLGGAD